MPRKRHDTDKTSDSGEEVEKKKTIKSKKMLSKSKNKDSSSEEDSGSSDSDGSNSSSSSDSSSSSSSSSSPDIPDPPAKERKRVRATKSAESGELSDSDEDSNPRKVKSSVSNTRKTKKRHDSEDSASEQDSDHKDRSKRSEVKTKRGEKLDVKVERLEEEEENFEMEPEPEWKRERNWSSDEEKQNLGQTGSRERQRISEVHLVKQEIDSGKESSGGRRTDRYDHSVSPDVSRYRDRDAPYPRDGRRDDRNERDDRRNRHRDRDSEGRYDRDRRRDERNGGRYDREERQDRDDRYRRNDRRYESHGNDREREKRSDWRNDRDRREGRREEENNEKRSDRRNDRDRREGRREEENNKQENMENTNKDGQVKDVSDSTAVVPVTKPPKDDQNIMTRTGGAYIPPARLRMMQQQITDKSSVPYQRMAWEALKKSINGLINKVNIANINFIVQELFQENIVRGRGVLARSIIQAQSASPTFTHVYAALVAIINTKFPQNGELILKRLVIQFRKGFRRNDKTLCLSSTRFLAHLVNQQVAHEVLALEILTLLLYTPTDDSVEIAVGFLKECGQKLQELSPRGVTAIFDRLRNILHEGQIDKRVQYMTEVMFAVRKDNFKDFPSVLESLDLIEEEEQFTHLLSLEQAGDPEDILNVFKADESYLVNEEKYKTLKRGILEESSSDDGSADKSGSDSSSDSDSENEDAEAKQTIIDTTETNMVVLRRTIYLTIQSSLHYEECAHKLLKMDLKPGQEVELCNMILDCCSQLRTYEKFFGLLAQRFCQMDKKYVEPFQIIFKEQYETIHRLETSKLRNVAKFFAHLLYTDAISWGVLCCISINEEDTTSASRIFIKLLFQELSEYMGLPKLNDRFKDSTLQPYFEGIMPRDNPKNTRFAINFFTTIGLGGLTEDLRNHLKDVTKQIMEKKEAEQEKEDNESSDSSDNSDSSSSSSSSSGVDSDSESSSSDESDAERKKKIRKKKEKESKKQSERERVKDTVKDHHKLTSTRNNGDAYTDPWERQSNRNNQHRRQRNREIEQENERDLEKAHKSKNKRNKSHREVDEEYEDNYQSVSEKSSERYREKERDQDSDRHRDSEKSRKSHKKHQNSAEYSNSDRKSQNSAEYSNSDRKRQNSDNGNSDRKRQNSDNRNSDRKKQSRNDYSDSDRKRQDRENYSNFERNRQGSAEYSKRSREDDYGRERSVDIDRYGDGNYKRIKREMNEDEYYEDSRRKKSHQDDRERSYYNHNKENMDYSPRKRRYDNSSDEEEASAYKKRSKNSRYEQEQSPQRSREHRRR